MTVRPIVIHGDPVLHTPTEPVDPATIGSDEMQTLIADMYETMEIAHGVGLAANQIGVARQVVVVDRSTGDDERRYQALVNPVLSNGEGSVVDDEGCLSVRECYERVRRFRRIHVSAQDEQGNPVAFDAEDRFARILQHEVDHLNGVLFIDHLSSLKRVLYKKKLKKILRDEA